MMNGKGRLFIVAVALLAGAVQLGAFDVDGVISRMKDGQNLACGKAPDAGFWIVSCAEVSPEPGMSPNEVNELGLALAKKEIAAFFGTTVKSSESASTVTQLRTENGTETSSTEEVIKEAMTVDVNQFLRGVALYRTVKNGAVVKVYCYTSMRVINAAADMERMKAQLPPDTVMAMGLAAGGGNESTAALQQRALLAAKRFAVEQVLTTSVAANTQVQDSTKIHSRIYADASGFVEEFRIVSEGVTPDGYMVKIVAKVARNKLMSNYASFMKAMGDPGFAVVTNQKDLYMYLCDFFSGLGVRVVADQNAADYIIDAMGDFRGVVHPATRINGVQLSLWVRIFNAKTGKELFAVKNDPRRAAVFHATGERQVEIAAEKACAQLRQPLHEKLNQLIGKMSATGREIQVVIDNYSEAFANELQITIKAVEGIPGCSNVNVKVDDINQQAVITANYTATMEALADFLKSRLEKDIAYPVRRPKVKGFSNNTLNMTY